MGLDIYIKTDQDDRILKEIYSDNSINLSGTLSRSFLPLVFRQHELNDEELTQISQIAGVNLMPLLEMGYYPNPIDEEYQLSICENDEEKRKVEEELTASKEKYAKPIEYIINILVQLDTKLKSNPDYFKQLRLSDTSEDYLSYFKNYSVEPDLSEYGFIAPRDTTLGVDIRAMIKYLEFAKSRGAKVTYFEFG
jgi:hypothetical protein